MAGQHSMSRGHCEWSKAEMGERSAVETKSGKSVHQSDPGLRRPTSSATVGRKPAARPPILTASAVSIDNPEAREVGLPQRKTGQGAGQSPAIPIQREALDANAFNVGEIPSRKTLEDSEIASLLQFFEILNRWDREAHDAEIM
jgi:hypothetical protein